MATEVFNRHETKYLLDAETATQVIRRLAEVMAPDKYNKNGTPYPITNIYYDTPDSHLIRTSLSKPAYKEKLRLRAYGTPNQHSSVFVEIKKKYRGIVNKRRSTLLLPEAYQFLSSGIVPELRPYMNGQVLNEAAYLLSRLTLVPQVYIAYDRIAFHDIRQPDLRVSFDANIRTRRTCLRLEEGDYGCSLLKNNDILMEIKALKTMPGWLCRLLSEYRVYPSSFSKYGREYLSSLEAPAAEATVYIPAPSPAFPGTPIPA